MTKKKTYIIILSERFPVKHARAGQETNFREKILKALNCPDCLGKVHTIRASYDLWRKRIADIQAGKAVLSVRQWIGKPYCSKQTEVVQLTAEDGVGLQRLEKTPLGWFIDGIESDVTSEEIARRDGLTFDDWKEWFKGYDLSSPLAIIHFTGFRYPVSTDDRGVFRTIDE